MTAVKASPQQTAIKAAMAIAKDVAEGRLSPAELDAAALEECRELFGGPSYPGDALWELHGQVARQYLAAGGVPANELAEWLAVARQHEHDGDCDPLASTETDETGVAGVVGADSGSGGSWIELALAEGADDETEPCYECLAGVCTEHDGGLRWTGTAPASV